MAKSPDPSRPRHHQSLLDLLEAGVKPDPSPQPKANHLLTDSDEWTTTSRPKSEDGASSSIDPKDRLYALALTRTRGVSPLTFFDLMARYQTAEAACAALPHHARRGGGRSFGSDGLPNLADASAELARCERRGIHVVMWDDPHYPRLLREISDPPPVLNVQGSLEILTQQPHVSIVGARNASLAGMKLAGILAADIGQAGYTITSGLARGIDGAAHQGALPTGTVAVMAAGLDTVYPTEHQKLFDQIVERGAVISEMPLGTVLKGGLFPRRNRLVSGIAMATLVVEASARSGSLITARLAGEQGRDVLACPGHILDPRSIGTNTLIREGATLIRSAIDVIDHVQTLRYHRIRPGVPPIDGHLGEETAPLSDGEMATLRQRILDGLTVVPIAVDDILRVYGYPPSAIRLALVELELAGHLIRLAGGRIARVCDDV